MTRFDPHARERELEDEIRVHLEMAVRERVARGEERAAAERAALAEFGDVTRIKAAARAAWSTSARLDAAHAHLTANDRLKQSFRSWFWAAMIVATLVHSGVFVFWPELVAADYSIPSEELLVIPPPEIPIPAPPEPIARPALPVPTSIDLAEDLTIPRNDWESNPVETLPPPPARTETAVSAVPGFTPHTVAPQILNRTEVTRAMEREYPPLLRDANIGGTVLVYFYVDEGGVVRDRRVHESSGQPGLDEAALAVAEVFRFSPALNRDQKVPVWVLLPIRFEVR
jgi:periplasmic protein TonB